VRATAESVFIGETPHRRSYPVETDLPPQFGVVVSSGPEGEADYTDGRYWVRPLKMAADGDGGGGDAFAARYVGDASKTITVHNLRETVAIGWGGGPGEHARTNVVWGIRKLSAAAGVRSFV